MKISRYFLIVLLLAATTQRTRATVIPIPMPEWCMYEMTATIVSGCVCFCASLMAVTTVNPQPGEEPAFARKLCAGSSAVAGVSGLWTLQNVWHLYKAMSKHYENQAANAAQKPPTTSSSIKE